MLKAGDKLAHKLSKRIGQVSDLRTVSTGRVKSGSEYGFLYGLVRTANAQFSGRFTQVVLADSNLLSSSLHTVSTVPITNTNLYKGIVS
jgi:hypothetical protein